MRREGVCQSAGVWEEWGVWRERRSVNGWSLGAYNAAVLYIFDSIFMRGCERVS
jgi:hypothetical protein